MGLGLALGMPSLVGLERPAGGLCMVDDVARMDAPPAGPARQELTRIEGRPQLGVAQAEITAGDLVGGAGEELARGPRRLVAGGEGLPHEPPDDVVGRAK